MGGVKLGFSPLPRPLPPLHLQAKPQRASWPRARLLLPEQWVQVPAGLDDIQTSPSQPPVEPQLGRLGAGKLRLGCRQIQCRLRIGFLDCGRLLLTGSPVGRRSGGAPWALELIRARS